MSDLEGHLARNETMWRWWREDGVTESTPLAVDFSFYANKKSAADALAEALREVGFDSVEVRTTRTLWVFKGWSITVVEHGTWSLEKLQDRVRLFCRLAANPGSSLEGCGAMMPEKNNA